jgi:hypothetical protein
MDRLQREKKNREKFLRRVSEKTYIESERERERERERVLSNPMKINVSIYHM